MRVKEDIQIVGIKRLGANDGLTTITVHQFPPFAPSFFKEDKCIG